MSSTAAPPPEHLSWIEALQSSHSIHYQPAIANLSSNPGPGDAVALVRVWLEYQFSDAGGRAYQVLQAYGASALPALGAAYENHVRENNLPLSRLAHLMDLIANIVALPEANEFERGEPLPGTQDRRWTSYILVSILQRELDPSFTHKAIEALAIQNPRSLASIIPLRKILDNPEVGGPLRLEAAKVLATLPAEHSLAYAVRFLAKGQPSEEAGGWTKGRAQILWHDTLKAMVTSLAGNGVAAFRPLLDIVLAGRHHPQVLDAAAQKLFGPGQDGEPSLYTQFLEQEVSSPDIDLANQQLRPVERLILGIRAWESHRLIIGPALEGTLLASQTAMAISIRTALVRPALPAAPAAPTQ